jgi:ubiquinone/menaquinone biosynthesis C-methylase UbiE
MASIGRLPFADGTFDLLCTLDIIEHMIHDQRAIAELARVATMVFIIGKVSFEL